MQSDFNIKILSYNIHKGFGLGKRKYTLDLIKKGILESGAELLCLQEVCGTNINSAKEKIHPLQTQFEYLADGVWPHFAYGKNAVYKKGDHGNAILSKYPIVAHSNLDLSTNPFESRGLLHATIELPDKSHIEVLSAHLDLLEAGRVKQTQKINEYIQSTIDKDARVLLAGDFNDWRENVSQKLWSINQFQEIFISHFNQHARTFPSFAPVLKLDRIYFRNLISTKALCLGGEPWKRLSDHSPLYAEFNLS